ncbi:MAG: peptidylprolyl isomerase [Spirochaetia bacterium]
MPAREDRRIKNNEKTKKEEPKKAHKKNPLMYWFSVALLIVIAVTFIGAPIVSRMSDNREIVFGRYKNRDIVFSPGNYFSNQVERIADENREQSQDQNMQYEMYRIWRQAFEQTALHTAIALDAQGSGMLVSSDRVDEQIVTSGPYMENGEFSEERYRAASSVEKFTTRNLFREQILHNQYMHDQIVGTQINESEIEFLHNMLTPRRSFRFVSFSAENYPEESVIEYAENNSNLFRKANLSRITINTGAEDAEAIRMQIENNEIGFEDSARANSTDGYAERGGDMGWVYSYQMADFLPAEEDRDTVFSLEEGDLSPVFQTSYGHVIFRVDESVLEPDFEDDDNIEAVRSYMDRYARGEIENYMTEQGEAFRTAAQDSDFTTAANELDLEIDTSEPLAINYGNMALPLVQSIDEASDHPAFGVAAYRQRFFTEAFGLEEGEVSEPILLGDHTLVLQLEEENEENPAPYGYFKSYFRAVYLPSIVESEILDMVLNSEDFIDNFNTVFQEELLGSNQQ